MPNQPLNYQFNPLPQAKIPQRPAPPTDLPENLYKPPLAKAKQSFKRSPSTVKPEPAHKLTRSTAPESPRTAPDPSRFQTTEAQAIARRVQDTSRSTRLEHLLRCQESKRYEHWSYRQPSMELEHLAIAKRPDRRYQIVIKRTKQSISGYAFDTKEHCAEAAAELEQRFALGPMVEGMTTEVAEAMEAIVRAAVTREFVKLKCTVA
jgi:hypothetical protein